MQKTQKRRFCPGEWGVGLKEPTLDIFLLLGYKTLAEMHFGPCYLGSKGLHQSKKKKLRRGGNFWEAQDGPKFDFWAAYPPLFGQTC